MSSIDSLMHRYVVGRVVLVAACLVLGAGFLAAPAARAAEAPAAGAEGEGHGVDWQAWTAGNQITDTASLQRGATNFVNY
jgi:cytochrome c1